MDDPELLRKFRPVLTEITDVEAMDFFTKNGEILSVNGKRAALDTFVLVLAAGPEKFGPYPLNSATAKELCSLLIEHGFGPPELQRM